MMRQYVSEYRMIDSKVPTNKGSAGALNDQQNSSTRVIVFFMLPNM
jgi:hypothetical protein